MPEGDSLWNHAAELRPVLVGRELEKLHVHRSRKRGPGQGVSIIGVDSRGKHLLITFSDGVILHTHLQMTGDWRLYRRGERWRKSPGAMRAVVATAEHEAVCFAAPTVELFHPAETAERPWERIGPDLCLDEVAFDSIMSNVAATDPRRHIADVLLDQRLAAGIGNVYKSETLWACKVHPMTPLAALDDATRRQLYETASNQLRSNLGNWRRATYRGGLGVYGKSRQGCPLCHGAIRTAEHGEGLSRLSYWCESCQPRHRG